MLREHEIEDISEVRRAYLEPDGQITVLRKKPGANRRQQPDKQKAM